MIDVYVILKHPLKFLQVSKFVENNIVEIHVMHGFFTIDMYKHIILKTKARDIM